MHEFTYKATVIIPVYNVEKYVAACIDSVISQTIHFKDVQVLLINDGSTDSSEEICKSYSQKYQNVLLFSKKNEGLSKTRNFALSKAEGKYIFYLDSDDTLEKNTIKDVTSFFDSVYDEVDLVTYRITQYFQGRPAVVHFRYKTLTYTGVYDLLNPDNRFITQTNINICVKNKGDANTFFDTTPDFRHEDEKYCCEILSEKMKIGYCSHGEYIYNRNNVDSIVSTMFSPDKIFESSMKFYEELFERYYPYIPEYFQGIVFNDLRWKLMDDKLLPTHYTGEEWDKSAERINNLLKMIDEDTIVMHPSVNETQINYWLSRKPNCHPTVFADDAVYIFSNGKRIFKSYKFKAYITSLAKNEDSINVTMHIESPIFTHCDDSRFKIEMISGGKSKTINNFSHSKFGAVKCSTILNYYPEFTSDICLDDEISFNLIVDGIKYPIEVFTAYEDSDCARGYRLSVGKTLCVKSD